MADEDQSKKAEEDQSKKKTNNPKSYRVRKECIKRKSMELATLCDIKVCTVITGPNGELQTWPDNLDACKEVLDLYSQNLKPEKKHKESSTPVPEEEQGEKDLLTLVESKLAAVNRRIRFLENKNVALADKGKKRELSDFFPAEAILLGFQHYLVMLGTTVIIPTALVPQMGGGNEEKAQVIQTSLFVAGLNTLLQSIFGTRLPAVIGGSYTFVAPTISIILSGQWNDEDPVSKFKKIMRATQGSLIVASTLQIVLGFSGLWRNVTRFLSPLSAVPLVSLVGFGLYEFGFPGVAKCVEIGLPELVLLVIFSQYLAHLIRPGKNIFDRFAVLFTVIIVWIYAHLLTVGGAYNGKPPKTQASCRTDRAGLISGAQWISIPYPFQWGPPSFNAGEAFAMMMASFVALVESTGAFIAVARYASATPLPPSILSRGVGWQGVGILLSGLFGTGNGSSVSVENAGLLALTRVGSRRVVQISAAFMIFFSILGKFGAVFASIPAPIVGALYCLFFAYVGAGGLGFLQFCNLNSFRTKFILGFSVFLGLSIPQYFNEYTAVAGYGPVHTHARWFNDMANVPFQSKAFVAGIVAFFLDNTMHKKDGQTRKDRGKHWWDKFKSFKTDTRSEEFYSLPFNLNKYFPSV